MTAIDVTSDDSREAARRARARAPVARGYPAAGQRQRILRPCQRRSGRRHRGDRAARATVARGRRGDHAGAGGRGSAAGRRSRLLLPARRTRRERSRSRTNGAPPTCAAMKARPEYASMPLAVLPPPFLANLRRGGVVRIPRTHQFLGTPVEKLVAPDGDRALVLVPVVVEGALIGVAGFAAAVGSTWEQGDMDLLQLVAQGVARTVETQARRRRAQRRGGPLPGDVRRLAAGHLPGGTERRRALPESGRQRIIGLSRRGDGGARVDERPAPGRPRAGRRALGHAVESRSAYTTPIHRFVHKNGEVRSVEVRALPLAGQPHGVSLARHPGGRHRPAAQREGAPGSAGAHRGGARGGRGGAARGGSGARRRRRDPVAHLGRVHRARPEGRYTYANDRALALCGHTRDEIIGHNAWEREPAARRRAAAPRVRAGGRRAEARSPSRRSTAGVCTRSASTRRRPACRSSSRTSRTASGTRSSWPATATICGASWWETRRRRSSAARPGSVTSWSASRWWPAPTPRC